MKSVVAANLFRGPEAVGGKLHFEETQLVFRSHAFNIQTGTTTIPYTDIVNVQPVNNLGFIPNGMLVTTKDGHKYKFVVWKRKELIAFLQEKAGLC